MKSNRIFIVAVIVLSLTACQSAINKVARDTKYSAWEVVGVHKRDLFKKQVVNAKENQEQTGEAFKDALTQLKEVYAFDGGNREREYRKLNGSYERASGEVEAVRTSIQKVETVASDLFVEWQKEIAEIGSADLRAKSSSSLAETKRRYGELHQSLKKAESKMGPVLAKFKDQTLFLKHNLNAKAVASLKGETLRIEKDIQALMTDMNSSIAAADKVIKNLE